MNLDPNLVVISLVPVIAPLATALVKWLTPRIPPWALPTLCAALGTLATYIATATTSADLNPWLGILLGVAGIGVREILDQTKKAIKPPEENP